MRDRVDDLCTLKDSIRGRNSAEATNRESSNIPDPGRDRELQLGCEVAMQRHSAVRIIQQLLKSLAEFIRKLVAPGFVDETDGDQVEQVHMILTAKGRQLHHHQ